MSVPTGLPGADLVEQGVEDLAVGRRSIAALVVSVGAPRLRRAGLAVPDRTIPEAEHGLYDALSAEYGPAAHSKYNALISRLVSFERAAECVS